MGFPSLTYQRPAYVSKERFRQSSDDSDSLPENRKRGSSLESGQSGVSSSPSTGIPDALAFDRIMSGGTCPVSPL